LLQQAEPLKLSNNFYVYSKGNSICFSLLKSAFGQ